MCEYKLAIMLSAVSGTNFWSHITPKSTITQCLIIWFISSEDRVVLTEREYTKHVTVSKLYKNKLVIKKRTLWHLFYEWRSTVSRLEPLRGGSLHFISKFSEIPGTHFINLGKMKRWIDLLEIAFMSASHNFKHKWTPSRKALFFKIKILSIPK